MCSSAHKILDSKFFFVGPFPQKVLLQTHEGERLQKDKKIAVFHMACIEIQLLNVKISLIFKLINKHTVLWIWKALEFQVVLTGRVSFYQQS